MAEISRREKILLGYSPNSQSNYPSRRNSEVDFSDVFGGPPRRSSTHDYYSEGGGKDSFDSVNDEETQRFRSPWLGFGEKPVFGDEVVSRRRYHSGDFYDDIFKGDQPNSCSQSPRRREPLSSAPGSRIMSPSRVSSSVFESSASPVKFSLPAPLANADFMASPSINQSLNSPSFSMLRLNQSFQTRDVLRADHARLSYRPSPLSHNNSVNDKELANPKRVDGRIDEQGFAKDLEGSELLSNNDLFHFSIYKWASKGVPSVTSLRKRSSSKLNGRIKLERCLSTDGVKSDNLDKYKVDMLADETGTSYPSRVKRHEHRDDSVADARMDEPSSSSDISPVVSKVVSTNTLQTSMEQACTDTRSYGFEKAREFTTPSKTGSWVDISNDSPKPHVNTSKSKSNMKPLKFFFQEKETGNERVMPKKGGNKSMVSNKGQSSHDGDDVTYHKINRSRVSQSFREIKDDCHKNEGTKKVKDFVKIFNQESSTKAKKNIGQSQSSRWNETFTFKEDHEVKLKSNEKQTTVRPKAKESKILPEASDVVDGISFLSKSQQFDVKIVGSLFEAPSSVSADEPITDACSDSARNINAISDDGFMKRESPEEDDVNLKVEHEELQSYERKILQWSKGKEGNIRALLSTLQYVLWPDSGWKPVPLVDIIEANAVKRAYQRALLRLHPDKLQQKGAAVHQKFIAEKVFDMLQEAWDQFNSLGPI